MTDQRWHRRSYRDGDTHWGLLQENGFVTARCGIVFRPNEQLFSSKTAERDVPPQPSKLCRPCKAKPVQDPDADQVYDLMSAVGSGRRGKRHTG
jgi:hypothetical protein